MKFITIEILSAKKEHITSLDSIPLPYHCAFKQKKFSETPLISGNLKKLIFNLLFNYFI